MIAAGYKTFTMNPYKRFKALSHYPQWHNQPFLLSAAEMENPWLVLEEFFSLYNLQNLRVGLKQWLRDALYTEGGGGADHFDTHANIEKLVEAAWLLWVKYGETTTTSGSRQEESHLGAVMEDADASPSQEDRFAKRWLTDGISNAPLNGIKKVFRSAGPSGLQHSLNVWRTAALVNENGTYAAAAGRRNLLQFTGELDRLVEACFALHKKAFFEVRSGFDLDRPVDLQPDLLQAEYKFCLAPEELSDPAGALKGFYRQFSLSYACAELWDLFECVLTAPDRELNTDDLLLHYQCFHILLVAAWHLERANRLMKEEANCSDPCIKTPQQSG